MGTALSTTGAAGVPAPVSQLVEPHGRRLVRGRMAGGPADPVPRSHAYLESDDVPLSAGFENRCTFASSVQLDGETSRRTRTRTRTVTFRHIKAGR